MICINTNLLTGERGKADVGMETKATVDVVSSPLVVKDLRAEVGEHGWWSIPKTTPADTFITCDPNCKPLFRHYVAV
jgi:hypothetical protein